jgi:hypothetical protein
MRRYFPGLAIAVGEWEAPEAASLPPLPPLPRICVAGNLTRAKGFDVLLGCARDAAERRLPMDFVLLGRSLDNGALEETGRCALSALIRGGRAGLGAGAARRDRLPALLVSGAVVLRAGGAAAAGLPLAAFDLGAQSMRVRMAGGNVLPLGLEPGRINDVFLCMLRSVGLPAAPASAGVMAAE